ncbi:enolase C-terminal domain-like protein [Streptomyces sp. CC208A]|uniref:enolase C-terminal domain-like protein n=1 Tax=Streptomyces sp. CC208A TaxID=3044573 RepID=UPI0024A87088|nr:enolase C-terminal domain-like protein [Streptomyces sp. CC208A]
MSSAASSRDRSGGPGVERVTASAYTVPTDLPGGDATLTWDSTTLVLVEAAAGGTTGLGWTYGAPATAAVVADELAPVYDDRELERQLRRWTEDLGLARVKIKIGESWGREEARDLRRTALARRVAGDGCELYVDANGGYTRKQAVRVAGALSGLGVTWFEEPVSSDDPDGLRLVRDAVAADVAAGEYGYDLPYFARMAPVVDCLQADASRCGGITVWLRAAALAEALGLELSAHTAPHLHAHAAAAIPNARHLEWFHDHVRIESTLFHGALDPAGGTVAPGADGRPGHGMEFDRAAARPFRVR